MIISFSVENWMSFRDKVTFSMIASRERQHSERLPKVVKHHIKILPVAAIYGGNASGKTNFFQALSFVKNLIVNGTRPESLIPVNVFRLDRKKEQPVCFSIELLIGEDIYDFSFSVTREKVLEEKLVLIRNEKEIVLYNRHKGKPSFHKSLSKNQFLQFAFQGTRDNQLFLTNSVSQNVDEFRPIYNWFKDTLVMVAPDSRFAPFELFLSEESPIYHAMNELLSRLDTGITRLGSEEIRSENTLLPEPLKQKLQEELKEGVTARILAELKNESFLVTRKNGELIFKKMVAFHQNAEGTEVQFDLSQESDGSRRIIDLLPAFLDLSTLASKKVYVIDELDRSLHTLLTHQLLSSFLASCSTETRTQLLLTTHDALLMDQDLLRRDEMWITERDASGVSSLFSFSEYKDVRYDKDIRKSYLQGRLGGVPRILFEGALTNHAKKVGEKS